MLIYRLQPSDGNLMKKSMIKINEDLCWMEICLLGFKTDGNANGETFRIWGASDAKLCPIHALAEYIKRYADDKKIDEIFVTNGKPIGSQRISTILKEVIIAAGMDSSITGCAAAH